jgi:hypothetical protein
VLWCMIATEWKKQMRESKGRKQYWDESQELQDNGERKTMKWNKNKKHRKEKKIKKGISEGTNTSKLYTLNRAQDI